MAGRTREARPDASSPTTGQVSRSQSFSGAAATARGPHTREEIVLIKRAPFAYPATTPRRDAGLDARVTTGRNLPEATSEARLRPAQHCSRRRPPSRTRASIALSEAHRCYPLASTQPTGDLVFPLLIDPHHVGPA